MKARRLVLRTRPRGVSLIAGLLIALVAWEVAARTVGASMTQGDQVLPSLVTVVTKGFPGLSDYYPSGPHNAVGGLLALLINGLVTLLRVIAGLVAAIVVGLGLGLLVAAVRPVRLSVSGIAEVLRMLPALAMAPLFTLWFGATTHASIIFIVFSVAFIVLIAAVNAIANLPAHVTDYPRTLGVTGLRLSTRVILPAILPELRGPLVFGGLVAWTTVLASEMYGMQSGLGWMLNETLRFSIVDRMVVVAVVFSALALGTMKLLGAAVTRLTRWAE